MELRKLLRKLREVIVGQWGNGNDCYNRLVAAGYNYDEVQGRVNELLS